MSTRNAIKMINIQKSYLVHFSPIRSIFSSSVHFGSIWSTFVLLGPIGPNWSYSFLLVLFGSHWSYSIHFGSIRSILVLYLSFCLLQLTLVLFSPPWSYLVHMSTLVLIYPLVLFWSYLVHLIPILSYSVHFIPFVSTSVHFYALTGYVWIESTFSKSKFITKNIDLKFVISKILSIIFIVAILLLSHINVVFQFTFPAKIKWKSF